MQSTCEEKDMELDAGSVWVMVAAAMVLMMTPGLAFLYGGMTRAKSVLNMMIPASGSMHS